MLPPRQLAALRQFVDDELMRAPLLADQVVHGAGEQMRKGLPGMTPHERAVIGDLLQALQTNRQRIVDQYVLALREQVVGELDRGAPSAVPRAPKLELSLSLVDEEAVAVDVGIAHAIEAIRSVAEYESRELQTYVSALVGDMDVARDHNPFRAETHAHALWAAALALPLPRGYQLGFMRHAATPLAEVLRKAFAGASSRLESAGVTPATHRTLILPAGSRRPRPPELHPDTGLGSIREHMPVPASAGASRGQLETLLREADAEWRSLPPEADVAARGQLLERQRARLVDGAPTRIDQQVIELLSRLFDAILSDHDLDSDLRLVLSRLQAPALRVALRDPAAVERDSHPMWRFVELVAFLGETLPEPGDPDRERSLRLVQGIVDRVVEESEQTRELYSWAIERLNQLEQHRFHERCTAAADEIASLQALEDRLVAASTPPSTMHGALDVAQLDTVPAELIDGEAARRKPAQAALAWLEQCRPGQWVRMFMQGRWVNAQLLWPGERHELFLFGDGASDTTWAVRRGALLALHGENLLDTLRPRALVRDAAKQVMRRLARSA